MTRSNIRVFPSRGPSADPARTRRGFFSALATATALSAIVLTPPSTAAGPAEGQGPRIEVEAATVNLGQLNRGETGVARFVLRNVGDEPLRILKVKPG